MLPRPIRRHYLLMPAACALLLPACGGGNGQREAAPEQDEAGIVTAAPEVQPTENIGAIAAGHHEAAPAEGLIPGLTQADVNGMPEAPPLPEKITGESNEKDIEQAVKRQVAQEKRDGLLDEIGVDKRTTYLQYIWMINLHTLRRGRPSTVPGLTIGELEDQPLPPPLPKIFNLPHTAKDLRSHAWIVAMEERDTGYLGDVAVDLRVVYLTWYWQRPLGERQSIYQQAANARQSRVDRELSISRDLARFDQQEKARDLEHKRNMEREAMIHNPVLTPEEQEFLRKIVLRARR